MFSKKRPGPFSHTSHRDLSKMVGWGYSNIFEIKDRVGVDENVGLLSLRKPIKPVTLVYIPRVVHKNNRIQSSWCSSRADFGK